MSTDPVATHTWADDWSGSVKLEVSDGELNSNDTATVTINNANPVVEAGNDQTVNEGDTVSFSGSYTDAGTEDTQTIKWDFGDGTTASDTLTPTHIYADNGVYTVTLNVTDNNGGIGTDALTLTVNNVNPALGEIASPTDPASVNTQITTSCSFTDAGLTDTHNGVWYWGDGTSSSGSVSEENGAGTITGEHAYTGAGIYKVNLTVTDNDGGSASTIAGNYIAVYNPEGGFVTGGGWINSPAGAYTSDSTLAGKATFGFVSKYQKGVSVPTGNTEFQFKAADLDFKSTSYEWLVVANSRAIYKGTGTINGKGNYGLLLTVVDGDDTDKFRIKIWDRDNDKIIYDNEDGTAEDAKPSTSISGGSIVIHKDK
ncbi:PKD domain-containing protein [Methanosarcina sp. DH1]|nr:PKD domain-containing protein [Methanosarcina sp. DH1]